MRVFPAVALLLLLSHPEPATAATEPDAAGITFFEQRIRPVLVQQCYGCHSTEAARQNRLKAGLAVDTRAGLLRGGDSGPAILPGRPEASLLLRSLQHAVNTPRMPPAGKLPAPVLAQFEQWIRMGAPDPRTGGGVVARKGMSLAEGRRFWSFRPPVRPALPPVRNTAWPATPVDRFLLARLEQKGLPPAPDADLRSLIRRVTFDLLGLPPTPEEVTQFLRECAAEQKGPGQRGGGPGVRRQGAKVDLIPRTQRVDPASAGRRPPGAYERLVDRLLASPHFGERWGRHWLDAARYADSNGRDRNMFWFHAWRYRDYVIRSFNQDKPYDQFLREQIAGDLLPAASPAQRDELRIATGFLALGPRSFEELKPEVFRMDSIDEQIDVVGRSVLGLSLACARCHDHKFDPIPTRDYYALAGIFRGTEPLYGSGPRGIKATAYANAELQPVGPDAERLHGSAREYARQLQEGQLRLNTARSDRYRIVRRVADAKNRLQKPGADAAALQAEIAAMEAEIKEWDVRVKALDAELQRLFDNPPPQPGWAMAVRERPSPEDCRIHVRGETTNLGDTVPRGVLQVLALPGVAPFRPTGSGRRELAEWLGSPQNPLTARVFVNRVWQHLFGRGLVSTPDDFGVNGARPSHPELLDYLASVFSRSATAPTTQGSRGAAEQRGKEPRVSKGASDNKGAGSPSRYPRSGYLLGRGTDRDSASSFIVHPLSFQLNAQPLTPDASPPGLGWSVKALIRALVLSRAYRMATDAHPANLEKDPDNVYLWRMAPRRLEAEILRDAIMSVSGQLDPNPPAQPFLSRFHPGRDDEYRTFQPVITPDKIDHPHRSVYLPVLRGVLPELFSLFDFASPERPVAQRDESTVPAQALYLLNSPWVIGQARHTAQRLLAERELDEAGRVDRLYQLAFARRPTAEEAARARAYLASPEQLRPNPNAPGQSDPARQREERWTSFCQLIFASGEFRYLR